MLLSNRYFSVFRTAARGLEAQRIALATSAENLANANTTRTADGGPYQVQRAVQEVPEPSFDRFAEILTQTVTDLSTSDPDHLDGMSLRSELPDIEMGPETRIEQLDKTRVEYDPTHPHANAEGYVEYPDVNVVEEMTRMISANRVYEANLTAVQAAKEMIKRTLEI